MKAVIVLTTSISFALSAPITLAEITADKSPVRYLLATRKQNS